MQVLHEQKEKENLVPRVRKRGMYERNQRTVILCKGISGNDDA